MRSYETTTFLINSNVIKCSKFQVNKRVVVNGFHAMKCFQS